MQVSLSSNINPNHDANLKVWISEQGILFNRLRAKDAAAFKILYQQYAAAIFGTITRSIKDEEKAKSILEQTFCEVWQAFPEYDETKISVFTWIHQIASRKIKKITL
ncbi:RNA polymerase sigma factor [Pedobacter psychrodurus]|uniref:RNA polymerase sigma factor n=1 Tax=Pedobacter psychrodurus TaxID=2530456 RepID=UPI00292E6856|nr:sigma factor [Pedobacter psychrodurus]